MVLLFPRYQYSSSRSRKLCALVDHNISLPHCCTLQSYRHAERRRSNMISCHFLFSSSVMLSKLRRSFILLNYFLPISYIKIMHYRFRKDSSRFLMVGMRRTSGCIARLVSRDIIFNHLLEGRGMAGCCVEFTHCFAFEVRQSRRVADRHDQLSDARKRCRSEACQLRRFTVAAEAAAAFDIRPLSAAAAVAGPAAACLFADEAAGLSAAVTLRHHHRSRRRARTFGRFISHRAHHASAGAVPRLTQPDTPEWTALGGNTVDESRSRLSPSGGYRAKVAFYVILAGDGVCGSAIPSAGRKYRSFGYGVPLPRRRCAAVCRRADDRRAQRSRRDTADCPWLTGASGRSSPSLLPRSA